MSTPTLLASSFIDTTRLKEHLGRLASAESDITNRLTYACNSAISWMEMRTTRKLKARNYRQPVTVTAAGTQTSPVSSLNVSSTSTLKAGDDLLGVGLDAGTTIASITSGSAIALSKPTIADVADGATLTAGRGAFAIDTVADYNPTGRSYGPTPFVGTRELYVPEYPVAQANVWGIYWLDASGIRTSIPLAYARVAEMTGRIVAFSEAFPAGELSIQIECRAGYEQPTGSVLGHPEEWEALTRIQLRAAEVFFQDDQTLRGRDGGMTVGPFSTTQDAKVTMPADIEEALWRFWRRSQ